MSQPAVALTMTPAEFLAWERAQPDKHQYVAGEIFGMAGASREHNVAVGNVVTRLNLALAARPCDVYPSDMRVAAPAAKLFTYPDVSVVCAPPELTGDKPDTLLNPSLIVEVLSPSTEAYDRGEKFAGYRSIPSLRDYVLVSTSHPLVEHYARQSDGGWLLREARAGGKIVLSIGVELAVDEIYLKVFPAPAEAGGAGESG